MAVHSEKVTEADMSFQEFHSTYTHNVKGEQTVEEPPDSSATAVAESALPQLTRAQDSHLVNAHLDAVDPEALFSNLRARFNPVVHVHSLSDAKLTSDGQHQANNPVSEAFFRYMYASRLTWQQAFMRGESTLLSTKQDYLNTAQEPGTYLIEILGEGLLSSNGNEELRQFGLGYALLTLDRNGITDLPDFPKAIQDIENLARLREILNVSHLSGIDFPEGDLMDLLFDKIHEIAGNHTLVTRILLGEFLDGASEMTTDCRNRGSIAATTGRGMRYFGPLNNTSQNIELNLDARVEFDPQYHIAIDTALPAHPGVRDHDIPNRLIDGIFVLEPGQISARQARRVEKKLSIRRDIWEKISIATSFPKGGSVAVWSDSYAHNLDHAFAEQQEGNNAYVVHTNQGWRDVYRSNLFHREGSMRDKIFEPKSLNGILSLNMLREAAASGTHEILQQNAFEFVGKQIDQLAVYGHYAGREVVIPDDWPSEVMMTLDKKSSAHFRRYAQEAYNGNGCRYTEVDSQDLRSKFLLPTSEALKFVLLVNPYQENEADFQREKDLPPPLFTERDYIRLLRKFNIRVDSAHPVYTDYVQDAYLNGVVSFATIEGKALPLPPNQFEVIGQKVQPTDGVVVVGATSMKIQEATYLERSVYQYTGPAENAEPVYREFISRGGSKVFGLFPVSRVNGELAIPLRENHQRPIPHALMTIKRSAPDDDRPRDISLDRTRRSGYSMEALAITKEEPMESPEVVATRGFHTLALTPMEAIPSAADLKQCTTGPTFPSSSGLHEEWHDVVLHIPDATFMTTIESAHTKFKTRTRVRPVLLKDIISVGEASGPMSSPLLRVAYRELMKAGETLPLWSGPRISLRNQQSENLTVHEITELHHNHERRVETQWKKVKLEDLPPDYKPFYEIRVDNYYERDGRGQIITEAGTPTVRRLESATVSEETNLSNNTIVLLPCAVINGEPLVFLETRKEDLPLISFRTGLAKPEVVPAFRVDLDIALLDPIAAEKKMIELFEERAVISVLKKDNGDPKSWTLAPELLVAAGVVPERAYLRMVEVDATSATQSELRAYRLRDLAVNTEQLFCGHSINASLRGAHALNLLEPFR